MTKKCSISHRKARFSNITHGVVMLNLYFSEITCCILFKTLEFVDIKQPKYFSQMSHLICTTPYGELPNISNARRTR